MIDIFRAEGKEEIVRRAAKGVLSRFGIDVADVDIEIDFLDQSEMQNLNKEARGVDSLTDVLSFPNLKVTLPFLKEEYIAETNPETEAVILGEIYISLDRAKEQALEFKHSLSREVSFLVVHGLLHLLGFDHIQEDDRKEMEDLQEEILNSIGLNRGISEEDYLSKCNSLQENNPTIEEEPAQTNENFKCGFVAVLGRPNAGKSTLVNYLVGQKVAIVSWKPQTTRNKILGIRNDADSQIIFVDTPGLHQPKNQLDRFMMRSVTAALNEVDVVVYLTNAEKDFNNYDQENVKRYMEEGKKVILVVNKIDRVDSIKVASILTEISKVEGLTAVVPISAIRGKNVKPLLAEIKKILPINQALFPDDMYTDRSMSFITSEIIREKALRLLDEEIPYGIAVRINKYELREDGIRDIDADIIVQKDSHKGIVLGKAGSMIKKISTFAREDLEEITGEKIFLTVWVRVEKDWRDRDNILEKLGYNKSDYRGE